jgi:hypothetical protein
MAEPDDAEVRFLFPVFLILLPDERTITCWNDNFWKNRLDGFRAYSSA